MALTHPSVKIAGQPLAAVVDWNASHVIDGNIGEILFREAGGTIGTDANLFWDDTNKRLGVGTATPSRIFHVLETDAVETALIETTAATGALLTIPLLELKGSQDAHLELNRGITGRMAFMTYTTAGAVDWLTGTYYNGGAAQSNFGIGVGRDPTDQAIVIDTSKNVGIGTTAPVYKLQVKVGNENLMIRSSPLQAAIMIESADETAAVYRAMDFIASEFASMNGNVGIGTTSPDFLLDVESVDDTTIRIYSTGLNSDALVRIQNDAEEWMIYAWGATNDVLNFRANTTGNNVLTLEKGGNVGIGTITPAVSALLDLTSTTGALLLTRMTTAQRNALTAVNGMIIYNSDTNKIEGYENAAWVDI